MVKNQVESEVILEHLGVKSIMIRVKMCQKMGYYVEKLKKGEHSNQQ